MGEEQQERDAGNLVATVCIAGPALVALIPMAAAPALVAMAQHFGASGESHLFSQFVMTLPAAMLVVAAPLAGWLAGRIGQRAVLLASLLLYVIGGAGVLLADSWPALVALRLLLGLAGGGLLTSSLGLIGDHFTGYRRERLLGYATSAASLLAGLALVYGGRLVDAGGWQAPFSLYLMGIPIFLLAANVIRNAPREGASQIAHPRPLREILTEWPYFLLLVLLTLGMFTPSIQAGFVLSAKGIGSAETIGMIIASTSFVAVLSAWGFGFLRRWIGLHGFLAMDAASMGLGILLIGLANDVMTIFFGCALVGIGAGMSEPATASLLFRRLPAAGRRAKRGVHCAWRAADRGGDLPCALEPARHGGTAIPVKQRFSGKRALLSASASGIGRVAVRNFDLAGASTAKPVPVMCAISGQYRHYHRPSPIG